VRSQGFAIDFRETLASRSPPLVAVTTIDPLFPSPARIAEVNLLVNNVAVLTCGDLLEADGLERLQAGAGPYRIELGP